MLLAFLQRIKKENKNENATSLQIRIISMRPGPYMRIESKQLPNRHNQSQELCCFYGGVGGNFCCNSVDVQHTGKTTAKQVLQNKFLARLLIILAAATFTASYFFISPALNGPYLNCPAKNFIAQLACTLAVAKPFLQSTLSSSRAGLPATAKATCSRYNSCWPGI